MDLQKEQTISSEYLYKGKIVNLRFDKVSLQNGNTSTREIVEHPGGVCILALDENQNVLLVKQYRRPMDDFLLELPAGKIDPKEEPYHCGMRELEEETGYRTDEMIDLGKAYLSPGYSNEMIYMYMAENLIKGTLNPDEDEFLNVSRMPLTELVEKVMTGEILDAKTCIATLKAKVILENRK